ncbi:chemotaxis protein CheC [Brevibacillus panacihumi W25]|uniref:Chemotaxis protein CheC n=1 Tax=Brevibacillus panacihumi W25 TaxID=1408254 RepID=V6MFJ7_9BACL|nr:chemotaxis protein CheX [Brevibacillus panacihumi]EST56680.1 chemotaxis protein CheC [Brevibacillus panacihumi W25]
MSVQYLHPFLDSASFVIQQVCQVEISRGELELKQWTYREGHTWLRIGMTGQLEGDVFFGIQDDLALRIVSAMMGGFPIQEMDEMGKSAISELGNMISGNASTILSNQGIVIDITPPYFLVHQDLQQMTGTALTAPLELQDMGKMEIQLVVIK